MFGWVETICSTVGSFFASNTSSSSNSSHSSSNSQTIYEPDKVRVAELENQGRLDLIEGQKDLIELNARMQAAVIEANVRGFEYSANILKSLMADMNNMAQQRLMLIEQGHFEIVKNIEGLYREYEREIQKDNHDFQLEKLPQMFDSLNKFPENSAHHKMYMGSIDQQIQLNFAFVADKIKALSQRQQMLIESSVECKKMVLEQSAQLVQDRLKFLEKQMEDGAVLALKPPETLKALTQDKTV